MADDDNVLLNFEGHAPKEKDRLRTLNEAREDRLRTIEDANSRITVTDSDGSVSVGRAPWQTLTLPGGTGGASGGLAGAVDKLPESPQKSMLQTLLSEAQKWLPRVSSGLKWVFWALIVYLIIRLFRGR